VSKLHEKISINTFSIEDIDISGIESVISSLPTNGIVDVNIAEQCLILTLEGQNLCQEKAVQIDRWIGSLEAEKNKAWSKAALHKAKEAGFKTVKDKEWHAQADDDYIESCNQLTVAKACKKWLENKAGYFSSWHYALKTFLRRDYSIENASSVGYNSSVGESQPFPTKSTKVDDFGGDIDDIDWG
jgi:hypothetical protein